MKKRLLLFVTLLAWLSIARAASIVSVTNVRNVVPGYTGSFDIELNSGNTQLFCAYQFDMQLPDGLTFSSVQTGVLLDGHNAETSNQGSNVTRFTGYVFPTRPFNGTQGVLLTVYFDVSSSYSGTHQAAFSDITFTVYSTGSAESFQTDNFSADITASSAVSVTLDELDTVEPAAISGADVTVCRPLRTGVWNTLCLPFSMTAAQIAAAFGSGTQLGELSDVTYGYQTIDDEPEVTSIIIKFTSATAIAAHRPYIIKVPADVSQFAVSGVTITAGTPSVNVGSTSNYKKMTGTYVADVSVPGGGLYLKNNEFRYSIGTARLKAFHAWFDLSKKLYDYSSSATAGAPVLAVGITLDGATVVSERVTVDSWNTAPARYYNLHGQRVSVPGKGVYVVNGKKCIIK